MTEPSGEHGVPPEGDPATGAPGTAGSPGQGGDSSREPGEANAASPPDAPSDAPSDVPADVPADVPTDVSEPEAGQPAGETDPLSRAERERDEYRESLIRLQADFENYKKRMMKQQTEHLERAAAALVDKLLPVLDTADLALAHGGGEDVKQITGSLMGALEKEGLERIAGEGTPFDPTLHDAVAHEPGDGGGEQTVVEVLRAGYRWKGRVLRPAMVKVRG